MITQSITDSMSFVCPVPLSQVPRGPCGSRSWWIPELCHSEEQQAQETPRRMPTVCSRKTWLTLFWSENKPSLCPGRGHCFCLPRLFAVHTSLRRSPCTKAVTGRVENGPASHPVQMETNLHRWEYIFHFCNLPVGLTLLWAPPCSTLRPKVVHTLESSCLPSTCTFAID